MLWKPYNKSGHQTFYIQLNSKPFHPLLLDEPLLNPTIKKRKTLTLAPSTLLYFNKSLVMMMIPKCNQIKSQIGNLTKTTTKKSGYNISHHLWVEIEGKVG